MASEERLYFISMAAEILGMHPQTLRKYERLGLIQPPRTIGSMRVYDREEIERLRLIKRLVDYAGDRIQVMPGGGIKLFNCNEVVTRTGCRQIHVATFTTRRDDSTHHRPSVTFGGALMPPENRYDVTDRSVVEQLTRLTNRRA